MLNTPISPIQFWDATEKLRTEQWARGEGKKQKREKSSSLPNTFDDDRSMTGYVLTDSVTRLSSGHLNM